MTVLFVQRVGNALHADGDESVAAFADLPFAKKLRAEITQPRNIGLHRLYFALCARIAKGIGETTEFVDRAFRIEAGHVDVFEYGGKAHLVVRSLAFHKFDNLEFKVFWETCLRIMYERWRIDPAAVADLVVPEESQAHR